MVSCRYCNSGKIVKAGFVKSDKYGNRQRYLCKDCGRKFVEYIKSPRYSDAFKKHVVKCVVTEGLGIRQASRVFKLSMNTILDWIKKFKKN